MVQVKERSLENLMKGRDVFEPPRFMSTQQAAQQLLAIVERRKGEDGANEATVLFSEDTTCVAMARIGCDTQKMVAASLKDLTEVDMGTLLPSLIVAGDLQEFEN